jgi:hypothetical protein
MGTGSQIRLWGEGGTRARERELARLATRQHGVVAQRQLLAIGFSERAIKLRMDAGRLNAIHRGVYAVGHSRVSRNGRWDAKGSGSTAAGFIPRTGPNGRGYRSPASPARCSTTRKSSTPSAPQLAPLAARGSLPALRPLLRPAAACHQRRRPRQRGRWVLKLVDSGLPPLEEGLAKPACATGARRTKRGKDAGRPNSSAIWPTEDAAPRSVRRRQACAGVLPIPPIRHDL